MKKTIGIGIIGTGFARKIQIPAFAQCENAEALAKEFNIAHFTDDWREVEIKPDKLIENVPDTGFSRGFTSFAPKIIEAIQMGKSKIEHAATFEDGLRVQEILDAAHQSNENGCIVKL